MFKVYDRNTYVRGIWLMLRSGHPPLDQSEHPPHGTSIVIRQSLDPKVRAIIENQPPEDCLPAGTSDEHVMISRIKVAMERGKQPHASGGRTVIQIDPEVVVKSGREVDHDEVAIMEHIHRVSKEFPLPQPLGSVTYNDMTFIFMTLVKGTSLQEIWSSLSVDLKTAVRDQLNVILSNLRSLPVSSTHLGGGAPPICKDVRRSTRCSSRPINNEAEFNDFLLSTTKPRIARTGSSLKQSFCIQIPVLY
jgi:hypothetical protein